MALGLIANIASQLWAVAEFVPAIGTYRQSKRAALNEALGAIRKGLNRTRMFLKDPDFSDKKALAEIFDLWNDASVKAGIVNTHLGKILGDKSRFWSDHELFIRLGKEREIISLEGVVSEIDRLYLELK